MKRITIEPVSRIEGHAKITIQLDDAGKVADTQFQVTQVRGFEKFTEGRPFYEMPGITSRICGICPISHQLASSKACDAIMAVRIPQGRATAARDHPLRPGRAVARAELLLSLGARPAARHGRRSRHPQRRGVIEANPELARAGIELRKFGLQVIEGLAEERVHPSWIVPGGVKIADDGADARPFPGGIPQAMATTERLRSIFQGHAGFVPGRDRELRFRAHHVCRAGRCSRQHQLYDGVLRFRDADGEIVQDGIAAEDYADYHRRSHAARFLPEGAVLQARWAIPRASIASVRWPASTSPNAMRHAAGRCRVAGVSPALWPHAAQRVPLSLCPAHRGAVCAGTHEDPAAGAGVLDTHVRAKPDVNALEGVGMIEAPRGTLIHHYKVDENGAIVWANLIVATGHNNHAIGKSVRQVSEHFIKGTHWRKAC